MKAEALALARRTPVTRGGIEDFLRKVPAKEANALALPALDEAGVPAAMVLAFSAIAGGEKIDPAVTRALLPEVLSLDHVGPLLAGTAGSVPEAVATFLGDRWGDLELEILALLLGAEAGTLPRAALTRARWLARLQPKGDTSILFGGAVLRIKDADLTELATAHVNRAKRGKRIVDEALEQARQPLLDVLPVADGARLSSGYTVKKESSVGRNDPCPCGSGKKFKKCCALAETTAEPAEPKLDAATLGPDQTALLRPSEIASLETKLLSEAAFVEAFHRVVDFKQWDLALRMLAERPKEPLVLEALRGAYDARDLAAAEKLHALLPADIAKDEAFALTCMRGEDVLGAMEKEAHGALCEENDGARAILLAAALLRFFPALGVFVARGALHEGRPNDSRWLLESIEDARDRLLVSPFEPWWDVYDSFVENADDKRDQRKNDAKRDKLKADLRAARAASRKTAAELEKIQQRVAELDALSVPSRPAPEKTAATTAPAPDLVEERRRLKSKVEELQRIIGEGQEERRDLRRQLAERGEREEDDAPRTSAPESVRDTDDEDEGADVDAPRAVLVPRYSDRAAKMVTDLAADAAEGVLTVVAALAAGKPNAWGGVKQLAKVRGVLSARAGIHHRVLFSVEERTLEVLEVLHRKDLEQVVARLARI